MTNPTPRPALRKSADAEVHPAAPRPARSRRTTASTALAAPVPVPQAAVAPPEPATPSGPRTIEDTNNAANAAAAARSKKKPAPKRDQHKPASKASPKSGHKKRKFSGSTTDHLRLHDSEPAPAAPKPTKAARPSAAKAGAAKPSTTETTAAETGDAGTTSDATATAPAKPTRRKAAPATPAAEVPSAEAGQPRTPSEADIALMTGRLVELGVSVPKKLRKAARAEAKARGLDLDAVTVDLLFRWLTTRP